MIHFYLCSSSCADYKVSDNNVKFKSHTTRLWSQTSNQNFDLFSQSSDDWIFTSIIMVQGIIGEYRNWFHEELYEVVSDPPHTVAHS